jgi:hypothetical protein
MGTLRGGFAWTAIIARIEALFIMKLKAGIRPIKMRLNGIKQIVVTIKVGCTFCFLFFLPISSWAQRMADSTFDLYLLIGQSNMAGRGPIAEDYKNEGSPGVLMLDKNNNWVQAKHPLHFDKPQITGVGPGLRFGLEMAKEGGNHKIGLIPCAVGGTSIDVWKPGGYDNATGTHPYDDALKRLAIAMQSGMIKGVIWLQGESDSDSAQAKKYLVKLIELINRIRTVTGYPSLPFVVGELGRFKEQYQLINNELSRLPNSLSFTAVASSAELTDKGDQTHFDAASADIYGRRFAEKMLLLNTQGAAVKK